MTYGRKLPTGWTLARLADVCREITVGHVGPMADKYESSGVPFLRSQNILPFCLNLDDIKYIPRDFHAKLKKSALSPGDVAIVRTGYPGTACVIPSTVKEANCADLVIARPGEKLNPWFLAAVFNSSWGRSTVAGSLVGVAQQHFNVGAAKDMQVALPPLAVQGRIASILSAYDDLIENNTRRIAILEEMARRIYEEWFVRFRLPDRQKVRMVESALGPIPTGWSVKHLHDVAELTYGFPFKSKLFDAKSNGKGVVRIRDIRSDRASTFTNETVDGRYRIADGDILVGMDGEFHMGCWAGGEAWLNQRVVRFRPKSDVSRTWLFWATERPIKHLEATIVGTTVAHLSARDLNEMHLIVPPPNVMRHAVRLLDPLGDLELVLKKKNANLRSTRDLLLPKLISGEIDVSALPEPEAAAA